MIVKCFQSINHTEYHKKIKDLFPVKNKITKQRLYIYDNVEKMYMKESIINFLKITTYTRHYYKYIQKTIQCIHKKITL